MDLLTFDAQFELKYGRSVGGPASVSTIPITETYKAEIPNNKTKEMDSVKSTISSGSRSAFMEYTKSVLQERDEQRSTPGFSTHSWHSPLVHIILISAQRSPAGNQSGGLSQGQVPVFDARALKAEMTWDELETIVSKNLQATCYGMQTTSESVVTTCTSGLPSTAAVLMSRPSAKTQAQGLLVLFIQIYICRYTLQQAASTIISNINKALSRWKSSGCNHNEKHVKYINLLLTCANY